MQQDSSKTKNKWHGLTIYLWDTQMYRYYILHHLSYLTFKSKDSYRGLYVYLHYIYIHFITLHITKILSLSYLLVLFWIKYYRKNIAHFILIAWKISSGNRDWNLQADGKHEFLWQITGSHRRLFSSLTHPAGRILDQRQRTVLILRQQCCFAEGISRCLTASNPARARTYRGWVYRTKCRVPVYFMASGSCLLAFVCSPW